MSNWFSPLLFLLATSSEEDLRRQIEFFKAENEMLRVRVPKKRILLSNDERERRLKLGGAIGPGVLKLITIVHPRSYQRWQRRKRDGKKPAKRMGRTKTLESVRQIVLRLARETGWGYGRIVGELHKLRIHCAGRTTVRTILKEEGIQPSPKRGMGTWDEFVKIHAETLWQVDLFCKMTVGRLRIFESRLSWTLLRGLSYLDRKSSLLVQPTLYHDKFRGIAALQTRCSDRSRRVFVHDRLVEHDALVSYNCRQVIPTIVND